MIPKTRHICRCGRVAVAQKETTGEWLCIVCAISDMRAEIIAGENVTVSFSHRGISDVYLAPRDDGEADLFAPLVGVLPIKINWN